MLLIIALCTAILTACVVTSAQRYCERWSQLRDQDL
jgi:hypothetical protein